jgi:hypothetical protein
MQFQSEATTHNAVILQKSKSMQLTELLKKLKKTLKKSDLSSLLTFLMLFMNHYALIF